MLAYTPIDLPKIDYCRKWLPEMFKQYGHIHPYPIWECITLVAPLEIKEDFLSIDKINASWWLRYSQPEIAQRNPYLLKEFGEIYKQMDDLPFEKITHAQILHQIDEVLPHLDLPKENNIFVNDTNGIHLAMEPVLYKILLSSELNNNFFVSSSFEGERHFVSIPNDSNIFCVPEDTIFHGSIMPEMDKYIVSLFGILNKEKHQILLERSVNKYKKYTVELNDVT